MAIESWKSSLKSISQPIYMNFCLKCSLRHAWMSIKYNITRKNAMNLVVSKTLLYQNLSKIKQKRQNQKISCRKFYKKNRVVRHKNLEELLTAILDLSDILSVNSTRLRDPSPLNLKCFYLFKTRKHSFCLE